VSRRCSGAKNEICSYVVGVGVGVSVAVGARVSVGTGVSVGASVAVSVGVLVLVVAGPVEVAVGVGVAVTTEGVLVGTLGTYSCCPMRMTVLVRQLALINSSTLMR
jgi:hypothetical protein